MTPSSLNDAVTRQARVRSFHQSLRAAVQAGASLELGAARASELGGTATLTKIDRLEALMMEPSDFQIDAESAPELPPNYAAAFAFFEQTGAIDVVLDSLTLRQRIDEDLSRSLRPAWFYLALLLFVAAAGLGIFTTFTSPRIDAIRLDMQLMPRVAVSQSWIATWRPDSLLIVLPLLAVAMIGLGLATKPSAWVASLMGGQRYRRDRIAAMRNRIEGVNARSQATSLARGREARSSLLSDSRTSLANMRLMRLQVALPTLIITLIGGGGVLAYCLILFGSLVMLIRDMATLVAEQGVWP